MPSAAPIIPLRFKAVLLGAAIFAGVATASLALPSGKAVTAPAPNLPAAQASELGAAFLGDVDAAFDAFFAQYQRADLWPGVSR